MLNSQSNSHTDQAYINNIRYFMKWLDYKPMEELNLQDARNFILSKRREGIKAFTSNVYNSSISFLYKNVLHIPWDEDMVPSMRLDSRLPEVLSLEEVERLIDTANNIRNKAIIALLYSSGLRIGELVRLQPQNIHMSTMWVYVSKGKNHSDHWTILSQRALCLLIEYWRSYPVKRDRLFVSLREPHTPVTVNGIGLMVRKIGREAGIDCHPQCSGIPLLGIFTHLFFYSFSIS